MSANSLLLWMSARTRGSWAQFRAAAEELHLALEADAEGEGDDTPDQYALPLYQALRFNLQRTGHAEFFAGAGDAADWRVTPPTLAIADREQGWLGTLVGARSVALLERLRAAASSEAASLQTLAFPSYPDQILIAAADRMPLASIAERTRLLMQDDAPAALLASLPPVDDPGLRLPAEIPFGAGWRVERFSADGLGWSSAATSDARAGPAGLFRFSLGHQRYVLFCARRAASRIPGQVGKYLVLKLRRRQVLRYEREGGAMHFPASCRPPFLVERALMLCSGRPPSYEGGSGGGALRYTGIPESIAAASAALLRQELR